MNLVMKTFCSIGSNTNACNNFTYTLGKSLYIPLTSRSNSLTLPQTRGPGFSLPDPVIQSLNNVRRAEYDYNWSDYPTAQKIDFKPLQLDKSPEEGKARIEPPIFPMVKTAVWREIFEDDERMQPTAETLFEEVKEHLESTETESVVFAGEGEPTLRLQTLLSLSEQIQQELGRKSKSIPVRIVTNGLVLGAGVKDRGKMLKELKLKGVNELSIALMTSCPTKYNNLMQPCIDNLENTAGMSVHGEICTLIRDAVDIGFYVECTGVDRGDTFDMAQAETLATELGASFRWRKYFP